MPRILVALIVALVLIGLGFLASRFLRQSDPVPSADPASGATATPASGVTSSSLPPVSAAGAQQAGATEPAAQRYEEDLPVELLDGPGQATQVVVPAAGNGARIAIVIDDLGRELTDLDTLRDLGVPITYSVLPFEIRTPEVIDVLRQRGEEILCHLPMEASGGANPGPGALVRAMTRAELVDATRQALAATPGAVGVNNHMGSQLTADAQAMRSVLETLREQDLFFLDSRTSADTVGYSLAQELGIPTAQRKVFLDPDPSLEGIRLQWRRLLDIAHREGAAIAIGHPYDTTFQVLREEVAAAREKGYEFVPVSYLLERPGGPE